jgi:hypothetical protein
MVLCETQLRASHSNVEEIVALQRKQQEQLNGTLRTLAEGENHEFANTTTILS